MIDSFSSYVERAQTAQTNATTDTPPPLPIRVHVLNAGGNVVHVLRDDLLPGGTKQRACLPYLKTAVRRGASEFVYASPFCGFAQVALAISACELRVPCMLFCEEDKSADQPGQLHEFTKLAAEYGARIQVFESLAIAEEKSTEYAKSKKAYKIPLGFRDPGFRSAFEAAVAEVWKQVLPLAELEIKRVWTPIGSGTLASCLRSVVPREVELQLVDVGVLREDDERIQAARRLDNSSYRRAPELFAQRSELKPPVPSNIHYDAKLWRYLCEQGRSGDLWWNVAR